VTGDNLGPAQAAALDALITAVRLTTVP
jgi:hypothetical protein